MFKLSDMRLSTVTRMKQRTMMAVVAAVIVIVGVVVEMTGTEKVIGKFWCCVVGMDLAVMFLMFSIPFYIQLLGSFETSGLRTGATTDTFMLPWERTHAEY